MRRLFSSLSFSWLMLLALFAFGQPHGLAAQDDDYMSPNGRPLLGRDQVRYVITLSATDAQRASEVRAILYYQSIPPHYLAERFEIAAENPDNRVDTERLYYLASHLNVEQSVPGWKLELARASRPLR